MTGLIGFRLEYGVAISYVDGPRLAAAIIAGSRWVASNRVHLNDINVFPVPDGDTGTNLTLTLKAAADAVADARHRPLGDVASTLSRSVLLGARGNAGIIFAQFLRGFAREIQGVDRVYAPGLSRALTEAVSSTYEAMAQPVEGTLLTVLRDTADAASRAVADGESDLIELLQAMQEAASRSLARTPELLPVLRDAGVVDAGGEGFVDFLEGVARLLSGAELGDAPGSIPVAAAGAMPAVPAMRERDLKYRYCIEFIVEGPAANPSDMKVRLVGMGGSLTVIGGDGLARVHIHTNDPDGVVSAAGGLGEVSGRKVDDMRAQRREFIRAHAAARRVRIVTDSTADLPEGLAEELGITVVPLSVCFGREAYLDGVDLTRQDFYSMLRRSEEMPTTSQPSPEAFLEAYEAIGREGLSALSVHISSDMSGTVRSALNAAGRAAGVDVTVVDSRLVSAPLGLLAAELARASERGADMQELVALAESVRKRARVYFTVGSLDHLVKGGRIGRPRALVGRVTRLKPILTVEDGRVITVGRVVGDAGVMSRIARIAASEIGDERGTLGVVHAGRPEILGWVRRTFGERLGFESIVAFELGCVVGAHAGPGTWGVSYIRPE